jgi:putative ABC transport system permease protein
MLTSLWREIRVGLRTLAKNPGFTTISIFTLALGIGANSALFSVVDAVLLQQLPFHNPQQLVWVWCTRVDRDKAPLSIADFEDYRRENHSLSDMAAFSNWGANLTDRGEPERLQGLRISGNAFSLLGADAVAGRALLPKDDTPGNDHVVVLSYGLWQRRFGGDRSLVGQNLTLNGESYTVVGILPRSFLFPVRDAEMAIPLALGADQRRADRGDHFLRSVARLQPGMHVEQAQTELSAIASRLRTQYPITNGKNVGVKVVPLEDEIVGNFRQGLLVLLAAVGLVLLIACANLANLQLARASARRKEIAIRKALGAGRAQLLRQLMVECGLLALVGGALGLLAARWGVGALLLLSPVELPRANEAHLDGRVLLVTLFLSLLSGILFGLAPALSTTEPDAMEALKSEARGTAGSVTGRRARNMLVVTELALSLVLLACAGLLLQSLMRLQGVDPGFDARRVLATRLSLPRARYKDRDSIRVFYQQLRIRMEALPGVRSSGAVSILPLSGLWASSDFTIVGRPPLLASETPSAQYRAITPGYFSTMRIALREGRDFTEEDSGERHAVTIISEALARSFWQSASPLGAHIKFDMADLGSPDAEIVGVVADVKHLALDAEPTPDIYAPFQQISSAEVPNLTNTMYWVVRSDVDPRSLADAVRREARSVDREVAVSGGRTMEQFLSNSIAPRRFNLILLQVFAGAALLLSIAGIYGVISYTVKLRRHEIAVRMALGARPHEIVRIVMSQAMRLVMAGLTIGLVMGVAAAHLLANLLFGVGAADPATFTGVSLLIATVALTASLIPAWRAITVDPLEALRYE